MILDDAFVASRHKNEVLDAPRPGFVYDVLDDGAVDDGQHFLRHRLGGWKEARAEASDGKYGLADRLAHNGFLTLRSGIL
jgi:hypothetical protein